MLKHGSAQGRRPDQLPAGRHGLPREAVIRNQKERILRAVIDVTSVAGYGDMSVEDIIGTAGVSRRTFYDHYANKEAAFLAAYDDAVGRLQDDMRAAFDSADDVIARTTGALAVLIDRLASDPAMAEMCVVEVLAAGPQAVARRDDTMRRLATLINEGVALLSGPTNSLTAETIVGGIHEVVYARVLRGELDQLRDAIPDLVYALFLPYAGADGAAAARSSAEEAIEAQAAAEAPAPR
ncbi:TetR/AcrR family transcriptional regulator [Patulibacter defluvii]|uniref:TetR/AcrR family transcriptional regulator n=1 Tax=Patulibacter defluvii TaxID=3095358 RepID=UPI002A755704|nr:TetR/AcrR family transcriptional regulator [Patulibacter sp. DM4]